MPSSVMIGPYLVFVAITIWIRGTDAGEPCPPGFSHISGFCLYTVTAPVLNTWREAYDACTAQYGSKIIMINSDFFWQAILQAGASQLNIAPGGIWMGLNYTLATKTYQWVDGTELIPDSDWTLWAPGQPIVADKDKCVLLEKTYVIKKRFGWSLVDCDDPDTTGVALCVVDQGDFTPKPGSTGGQASLGSSWSLLVGLSLLLLGIRRAL